MPAKWIAFKESCRMSTGSYRLLSELCFIAAECAPALHEDTLVITSIGDGEHKAESMHFGGGAIDCRTHPNDDGSPRLGSILEADVDAAAALWAKRIRKRAGMTRQALYEKERKHLHVELDMEG